MSGVYTGTSGTVSGVPRLSVAEREFLWGGLLCLLFAMLCWVVERSIARRTGLSSVTQVVASDMDGAAERDSTGVLFEPRYKMYGRPDYVLRVRTWRGRRVVPVEVKPTRRARHPYDSDVMELVTYLLLVRATYPTQCAGYGLLRYADTTFRVRLTPELEQRCIGYARLVLQARDETTVHRNHRVAARCGGCGVRTACDEALR